MKAFSSPPSRLSFFERIGPVKRLAAATSERSSTCSPMATPIRLGACHPLSDGLNTPYGRLKMLKSDSGGTSTKVEDSIGLACPQAPTPQSARCAPSARRAART
eukprot:scaffold51_cov401-Prasinococcus_capsulatus_cf.AAC.33